MRLGFVVALNALLMLTGLNLAQAADDAGPQHLGVGQVHMEVSCSPAVTKEFDLGLALLHDFWYPRALATFDSVIAADPECAMAYWGAAMTYNHPFWDAPTEADERSAWALAQKGLAAREQSPRERMYLAAVAALFNDGGAGDKSARDQAYLNAMAAAYAKYPDDESKLFYALAILATVPEGSPWSPQQELAAGLIEQVYAQNPHHPGALHYMIHAYDDPVHAALGLKAAQAFAAEAPAVPHALHMPSHIFARSGLWQESADTNEKAWKVSQSDVKAAGKSGAYRDFHSLNYLQYSYLQLGRYQDAKKQTDIFAAQYQALPDRTTRPDSPDLEVRHLRGRTIYALPDRVVYGYFDTLARYVMETGDWSAASGLPTLPVSRDFAVMRLQIAAMAAAARKDAPSAQAAADKMAVLATDPGQRELAQKVLTIQAKEAQAAAAEAGGDSQKAIATMNDAVSIEDSIYALSQPPYPPIPAHELYGEMLLRMNRPLEAQQQFSAALRRTPRRSRAVYGLARCAQARGDQKTAVKEYREFLEIWKNADPTQPEVEAARRFLTSAQ